ncbi:mutator type transposase [Tanacetum coccineum]|uniref:Mutator type transposase n=1 Tax=Tanacetum coccineum TaxID=301880 RepID=A0ABQ5JFT9_9ASTR
MTKKMLTQWEKDMHEFKANEDFDIDIDVIDNKEFESASDDDRIDRIRKRKLKQLKKQSHLKDGGFDGAFMKGPLPSQLLTAAGVDQTMAFILLAYRIVETESRDSWALFFEHLKRDLDMQENFNFTFVSDRHKVVRSLKKRKKSVGENILMLINGKLIRISKTVTCVLCKTKGHNKRSCKGSTTNVGNKKTISKTVSGTEEDS